MWQLADVGGSQLTGKVSESCPENGGDLSGMGKLAKIMHTSKWAHGIGVVP